MLNHHNSVPMSEPSAHTPAVTIRSAPPRLVVRERETRVRADDGRLVLWWHWQVVEGTKVIARHELRDEELAAAHALAGARRRPA